MEPVVITERMKGDWERFVAGNPHTIAWQSYDWSEVLKRHYRFDFYPIAVYDGPEICGILPLYRLKRGRSGSVLMSVPYAVAGGIVADDEAVRSALLEKAISISRGCGSCPITLKQYKYKMEGDLTVDDNYFNRELNLTGSIDDLWFGLAERNRDKIVETYAENLTLEYPSKDFTAFYRILMRHLHNRGIPCVNKRWIEDLLAFDMYTIAFLKNNGAIVAATMVKSFKETVSFPFTCHPVHLDNAYVYRLYWELIRNFALSKKKIFHSGRIPANGETDEYRLGWGGDQHGYFYQYYPNNGQRTEFAVKRGRKRKLFENCWKMMPTAFAEMLGPAIVKRFP